MNPILLAKWQEIQDEVNKAFFDLKFELVLKKRLLIFIVLCLMITLASFYITSQYPKLSLDIFISYFSMLSTVAFGLYGIMCLDDGYKRRDLSEREIKLFFGSIQKENIDFLKTVLGDTLKNKLISYEKLKNPFETLDYYLEKEKIDKKKTKNKIQKEENKKSLEEITYEVLSQQEKDKIKKNLKINKINNKINIL